ncbi:hypothetical protein NC86S3_530059 [Escherichia coli]|nr:hypothetical protein AT4157R_840202 [Escherichia coli]SOQ84004.1 hypothetical protein DSM301R_690010 [Escherichia coli]SOQ94123.1 hypothetical protein NC86S2_1050060 [Escherichia coli]SOQ95137.1 hypothetical protein NC86S1_890008 [Escherichia coli]SOR03199.1 hypothetical protein NC86S3_530059 [Escherichia coli]
MCTAMLNENTCMIVYENACITLSEDMSV